MSVNPGTKYFAFAVFEEGDLVYWRTRMLKGRWSTEKVRKVERLLLDLIEYHRITELVIKRPHPSRSSRNLDNLVSAITRLGKRGRLVLRFYSLHRLKNSMSLDHRNGKMDIARSVTQRYPFLLPLLEKETKYHLRMFEAIAAGLSR